VNIERENARQIKNMRKNFKALRKERDWTVRELAELSGISGRVLKDIERGRDFDVEYIFRLCRVYGIDPRGIFSPYAALKRR
jgi:transcriptional regulator with XRE-family HTH domain